MAVQQADFELVAHARQRFPEHLAKVDDRQLRDFVASVRKLAAGYDVVNQDDVATAVDLTIMYGEDFYRQEWASDIFDVASWSSADMMSALRDRVRAVEPGI